MYNDRFGAYLVLDQRHMACTSSASKRSPNEVMMCRNASLRAIDFFKPVDLGGFVGDAIFLGGGR